MPKLLVVSLLKAGGDRHNHFVLGGVPRGRELVLDWHELPANLRWPDGSYLVAVTDGRLVHTRRLRRGRRLRVRSRGLGIDWHEEEIREGR